MQWMREKKEACSGRPCHRHNKRSLCGVCCILAGFLVFICFAPEWFVSVIIAFLLMAIGALLLGFR